MIGFGNEARDLRDNARTATPLSTATSAPPPFESAPSPASLKKVAVLGPTLRFKGELSAEEDFILQGKLEGSISNPQCVTVGTDGAVVGDIRARVITVDGQVDGDLHGAESVVVHQTGRVTGNIYAPRVGIVEGAYFNGRIEMGKTAPATQAAAQTFTQTGSHQAQKPQHVPAQIQPGVPLSPEDTEKVLAKR